MWSEKSSEGNQPDILLLWAKKKKNCVYLSLYVYYKSMMIMLVMMILRVVQYTAL